MRALLSFSNPDGRWSGRSGVKIELAFLQLNFYRSANGAPNTATLCLPCWTMDLPKHHRLPPPSSQIILCKQLLVFAWKHSLNELLKKKKKKSIKDFNSHLSYKISLSIFDPYYSKKDMEKMAIFIAWFSAYTNWFHFLSLRKLFSLNSICIS